MSIEIDFYSSVLHFLREVKRLSLVSPVITFTFASNHDSKLNLLDRCEEWGLVKITGSKKNEQGNEQVTTAIVTRRFDKVLSALETIFDDPWLSDETRIVQINKLLKIKKQKLGETDVDLISGSTNKIAEKWDRITGIWEITIPAEEKPIEIKLGEQGTETNETFFTLYSSKNQDVEASEIRKQIGQIGRKHLPAINVGASISKLRTWIRKGLGKKYNELVTIHHDKSTKKYRLEIKF